ncbi:Hpt domain-containing protein [Alteromonas sp. A081]|uniref:Hpt domain-containing protein n=1 Tax=Alteromonas sp. A081 TaxID=3410269 RepID=UPI003B986AB2
MNADTHIQANIWNAKEALARLGGNQTLLMRIVGMYLEQVQLKQQQLIAAIHTMNTEETRLQSHSLKGLSGDVGADAVREIASNIEQLAKDNAMDKAASEADKLDAAIKATIALMEKGL